MSLRLSEEKFQKFILEHENDNTHELLLKYSHVDFPIKEVVDQINSRKKAVSKLPSWYKCKGLVFPPVLSMEQCSSELTASFKASLLQGEQLVDLTGGAGVDSYFFSKNFKEVVYVEKSEDLCTIASHNFNVLSSPNIQVINDLSEIFITTYDKNIDAFYIDPARRDDSKNKVFLWEDCTPNIVQLMPQLIKDNRIVLVKASPLLDIQASINQLGKVTRVYVVAVKNECKEVLYWLENKSVPLEEIPIHIILLEQEKEPQKFSFTYGQEQSAEPTYSLPGKYLYEPNVAALKSGAFKILAEKFKLAKLHVNTHLYTSDEIVENFPGRTFEILSQSRLNKKELQKAVGKKANIATRNFPLSVEKIRKKTGLKPGGEYYLYACTTIDEKKVVLVTRKLS